MQNCINQIITHTALLEISKEENQHSMTLKTTTSTSDKEKFPPHAASPRLTALWTTPNILHSKSSPSCHLAEDNRVHSVSHGQTVQ
ncbi:uncharacterized protein LOC122554275 isoform X2 [Chiloscyllium plagiosum]|uniref:uncharacterized protein LOC122554275 isoform X2 n=1 Tax=Chiloscyllium plagiosum TaxID=36176 RepID=UPI001CB83225|nr:uncharacterized protein LOC122554275 isoform X2 [Chiloscyllium plagiosum]